MMTRTLTMLSTTARRQGRFLHVTALDLVLTVSAASVARAQPCTTTADGPAKNARQSHRCDNGECLTFNIVCDDGIASVRDRFAARPDPVAHLSPLGPQAIHPPPGDRHVPSGRPHRDPRVGVVESRRVRRPVSPPAPRPRRRRPSVVAGRGARSPGWAGKICTRRDVVRAEGSAEPRRGATHIR